MKQAMKQLWKREWMYWKRPLLMQTCIGSLLPVTLLILYKLRKEWLFAAARGMFRLPLKLYQLWGLFPGIQTGNFLFYLLFMIMFLNVWMICGNCVRAMENIYREERDGGIYHLCNQFYSSKQIGIIKFLWPLISSLISYAVCCLFWMIYAVLGKSHTQQGGANISALVQLLLIGSAVQSFFLSLSFFWAVHRTQKGLCFGTGLEWAFLGSLLVGNLYKVRNILCALFSGRNIRLYQLFRSEGAFRWLEGLYWISPFSWMNPFLARPAGLFAMQIVMLLALAGVFAFLGIRAYGPSKG